ncbi:MAG: hypothetical protein LBR28_01735 [Bacteroidales bacterium]|jgi:hypothetical protein|nr:hypothetical protein [Bacteroidales bacterium]
MIELMETGVDALEIMVIVVGTEIKKWLRWMKDVLKAMTGFNTVKTVLF